MPTALDIWYRSIPTKTLQTVRIVLVLRWTHWLGICFQSDYCTLENLVYIRRVKHFAKSASEDQFRVMSVFHGPSMLFVSPTPHWWVCRLVSNRAYTAISFGSSLLRVLYCMVGHYMITSLICCNDYLHLSRACVLSFSGSLINGTWYVTKWSLPSSFGNR